MSVAYAPTASHGSATSPDLERLAGEISAVAADIKKDFLAVGDCIIGAVGLFDEMRRKIEGATERLADEDLKGAMAVLSVLPERMSIVSDCLKGEDAATTVVACAVESLDCQTALEQDPLSASKRDPSAGADEQWPRDRGAVGGAMTRPFRRGMPGRKMPEMRDFNWRRVKNPWRRRGNSTKPRSKHLK